MSHRDMIDYFCINAKVAVELKLICDTVHTRWVASLSPYKENTFAEELTRNNIMASFTELCYLWKAIIDTSNRWVTAYYLNR